MQFLCKKRGSDNQRVTFFCFMGSVRYEHFVLTIIQRAQKKRGRYVYYKFIASILKR